MAKLPQSQIDSLFAAAQSLQAQGRLRDAARAYADLTRLAPRHAGAHAGLGWCLGGLFEVRAASAALARAVELDGTKGIYHYMLGVMSQRQARPEAALASFHRAIALKPDLVDAYGAAAAIYDRTRRPTEALQMYERGFKAAPHDAQLEALLWAHRAREGRGEEARDALKAILERTPAPPDDSMVRILHSLATVLEQLGDSDGAFDALRRSRALRATSPAARELLAANSYPTLFTQARELTRDQAMRWSNETIDDGIAHPMFLVGFPRSGTTMTEQVVGAHPTVVTSDERPFLAQVNTMVQRLRPGMPIVAALDSFKPAEITALRREYWREARETLGPGLDGKLLLDKNPMNIASLHVINRVFPASRVLIAIRDPRDVCLSCFMQWFQINAATVHFLDLQNTARFYADVMRHYLDQRPLLTLAMHQFRYEDMVADFEAQARQVLDFLRLPWNPEVLAFNEKTRSKFISTPSFRAVSEKVNEKAKGRWRRYESHLAPILPVLAPFIKEFGYE